MNDKEYLIELWKQGLKYREIAEMLNAKYKISFWDSERVRDKIRKHRKKIEKETLNSIVETKKMLSKEDLQIIELQKEKIKFSDQRNAFTKIVREEARWEEIKDLLTKTIKNNLPEFKYKYEQIEKSDNDLLVFLNDIHYGLLIDNYFNKYSPEIFKKRLEQYLNEIISIKQLHESENCYVFIGGDIISGNIHPQIQFANTENTIQQIQNVSEYISNFINELHPHFKNVYVSVVPGNHSRLEKNKKEALKDERLDLLIPWYVKCRLQNLNNVIFLDNKIDNTISNFKIRGKLYYGCHGDYDTPTKVVNNLTLMIGEKPYAILMGHLHHNSFDNIQGVKVVMSGTFSGIDDYCIEKRLMGKPAQWICVCTEKGIRNSYDIELN